ncbi:MAG: TIM barrel protein [bacterium]
MHYSKHLNFGVNTDSFLGIGSGFLTDRNAASLKTRFVEYLEFLNGCGIFNTEINTEIEQLAPGIVRSIIIPALRSSDIKKVSVHLPYLQLNPASPLEEYRQFSSRSIIAAVKAFNGYEADLFVIHLTSEFEDSVMHFPISEPNKKALIDIALSQMRKSLEDIILNTGISPEKLALENLEVFPFDLLYETVKDYGISICFDMGHWGLNGFMPEEFFEKFGAEKIREIHVQDMTEERQGLRTFIRREHQSIGRGILNAGDFFNYLIGINFNGSLIIENRSKGELTCSIDFLKKNGFLKK